MMDQERQARVAALSVLQAQSYAKLLRSHGLLKHATYLEAAIEEVAEILILCLGGNTMFAAMNWASDQLWWDGCRSDFHSSSKTLH